MKDATPQPDETHEQFLTARQLAAILQVSEATVRRLARKGRIPSIRLTPRLMRFHLASVREALDGGRARTRRAEAETEDQTAQLSFSDLF
jgi:excisionase family DNA binding protein